MVLSTIRRSTTLNSFFTPSFFLPPIFQWRFAPTQKRSKGGSGCTLEGWNGGWWLGFGWGGGGGWLERMGAAAKGEGVGYPAEQGRGRLHGGSGRGRLGLEGEGASNALDAESMAHNPFSPLNSRPHQMNAKMLPFN
jgi:hypothetical protein